LAQCGSALSYMNTKSLAWESIGYLYLEGHVKKAALILTQYRFGRGYYPFKNIPQARLFPYHYLIFSIVVHDKANL